MRLIQQFGHDLPVQRFEFHQMGFGCGGIAVSRCVHGFENQIGDTGHGGDHHNHALPDCGMADDVRTLAKPFGAAHRGAAKFHHDKTLPAHT